MCRADEWLLWKFIEAGTDVGAFAIELFRTSDQKEICMKTRTNVVLAVAAGMLSLAVVSTAEAKLFARSAAAQPGPEKVASPSDQPVPADKVVGVKSACGDCCQDRCIKYRHHCTLRKVCRGCDAPVKTILAVQDPCCCKCVVEIPICLPACCEGTPKVCERDGLLCRNVVVYEWCCGYRVRVVFDRCGDVVVHSYGR